jgi:hypothetical protein
MSRHQAHRRHIYGRRQHDVRQRQPQQHFRDWLLDAPGSAGGGELGTDRLRRPDLELDQSVDAA